MPIKEIERDLQKKDSTITERKHNKTTYNVWESLDKEKKQEKEKWKEQDDNLKPTRKKAVIVGGIIIAVIVFLLISAGSFVFYQKGFFAQNRVSFLTKMPETIDSNVLTTIVFAYDNDNRANLNNAKIIVQFSDYFIPEDNQDNFEKVSNNQGILTIGTIKSKSKEEVELAGHFVGPENYVDDIVGTLKYMPEKTNVIYETQSRASTTITSSPINININSPVEVVSGNLMDIDIVIKNTSKNDILNLKVIFDAPESFVLHSTQPKMIFGNTWLIDNVPAQSEKKVHIRGNMNAEVGITDTFYTEVGSQESKMKYIKYAQDEYTPVIVNSPFVVNQEIRGNLTNVIYAGDKLKYVISFQNNSEIPLREAIVSVQFDTDVLDFENLLLNKKGDYDAKIKKIIWKASDVPELKLLKPMDSGVVTFSIPVLNQLPVDSIDDKHFINTTLALIDSEDIPSAIRENKTVLSNVLTTKVGAKVIFDSKIEYFTGEAISKVGAKTVYKVSYTIDNINNDIKDAKVIAGLPTYVQFEQGEENMQFNERTNEVEWNIGSIVHGAGVTSDQITGSFYISITPSVDQINSRPILVKEQILTANDVFTEMNILESVRKLEIPSGAISASE
jgi:hypothetical protein